MNDCQPSAKMIKHAELNANILNIRIPPNVLEDSLDCWWFNDKCWEFRPPREGDFVAELALCKRLGIEVDLSTFKTKRDFKLFFSIVFHYYEASYLNILEKLQSQSQCSPSTNNDAPELSHHGYLNRLGSMLRKRFKRFR
ncbi:hypothetical protein [Marinobacter apostichopi]|uniref:hypothetical protein n=1 Tax=Marinobacter apostichopi TaxID=3035454 RepID=UPI002572C7EF|nr:hypothetical protein [Marinobacter sp. LA51]